MNNIKKIANHYGLHPQIGKLLEELEELQIASRHAFLDLTAAPKISDDVLENLIDEMADVAIMVEQVAYLTDTVDAVKERVEFKVNRQLERIAAEVNDEHPSN